ncbi:hypothetical protein [Nocardia lasii]|uniref:DUF1616 domain-containing protein n=1 Tax=Nocardia lasii TaxID=1616107 RepID=A0ABW1JV85_9NOCA
MDTGSPQLEEGAGTALRTARQDYPERRRQNRRRVAAVSGATRASSSRYLCAWFPTISERANRCQANFGLIARTVVRGEGEINAMRAGVQSPYANEPAVRRATRLAGSACLVQGIVLLACSVGLVISGLVNPQYLIVVCVVALLPGLPAISLLTASRRILRGEINGTTRATSMLITTSGLVLLATIGAIIDGPWPAKILMITLLTGTIITAIFVNRADRALKGFQG